jgi:phage tail sheath protein FI
LKDAACVREGLTAAKTGPVIKTYQQGIDVYSDKAAAEIQLLLVPGIRERIVTNYGVQASETRFDTMYLMDIEQKDATSAIILDVTKKPDVGNTIDEFSARGMDTSFAACFFPDVMLNKPNGGSIKVPPSIAALGVMSRADNGGNTPWYAPAGINRGLVNANATEFAISREQLDELYDNDINPIYIPAGRNQVHVFGQKTLLKDPSALDRINVRRLLIYVRRKVKQIANTFLFQPNREDTLKAFSKAVEPILANIQAQQGIERYKVQIDTTTTTQVDVENNTIRGKIYLQPTKSIEFISLDFEVRNSID